MYSLLKKYLSNVRLLSTSSTQKKSNPCKGKSVSSDNAILYPVLKIKNPKFEFQTPSARNSPAGTSELIPFDASSDLRCNCPAGTSELINFGAKSDIPWDWIFLDTPYREFLFAFPRWGLLCFPFVGNYIFPRWGFTMLLLSWGTT